MQFGRVAKTFGSVTTEWISSSSENDFLCDHWQWGCQPESDN